MSLKGLKAANLAKGCKSKAYVYEQHKGRLEVRKQKDIKRQDDYGDYRTVKIPPKTKQISLFTDPKTKSKVKTEEEAFDREPVLDYVLLARLHLDSFGWWNKVLLKGGFRDHLYLPGGDDKAGETRCC